MKKVQEYVKANGNECVFQNDKEGFSPMHWVNFKFLFNIYRFYERFTYIGSIKWKPRSFKIFDRA